MGETTAGLVVIGNEILSGKIADANTPFLASRLRELGVRLARVIVIEDCSDEIAAVVREAASRFDHVFTSGGVGPTHDDVTMRGVAKAFDRQLVRDTAFAECIALHYGEKTNDAVLSMADIPEGADLLDFEGLFIPVVRVGNVHVFPGIPQLFRRKFNAIAHLFGGEPYRLHRVYLDVDEGDVAAVLGDIQARFDAVEIGSYPRYDGVDYRVLVTLESRLEAPLTAARDSLLAALPHGAVLRHE